MKLPIAIVVLALCGTVSLGQELANREYGIGIASVSSPYQVELIFYSQPRLDSQPVARFRADSLTFYRKKTTVRSYDQMIELSYADIGFPVLEYSPDSQWVKVSLDCHDLSNTNVGWLLTTSTGLKLQTWVDILSDREGFFFLKSEWMMFYSGPQLESLIHPKIVKKSYRLIRRSIKNRWMEVELETPTPHCDSELDVIKKFGVKPTRRVVWIQFLDERNRPRIFYLTRGC